MSLSLPEIPIAVGDPQRLVSFGQLFEIRGFAGKAVAFKTNANPDERCVWVVTTYRNYRAAWNAAAEQGLVDALSKFGASIDVDHLYPRSWAEQADMDTWWLRLYPVYAEVNRSAGAGREKSAKNRDQITRPKGKIIYADELQMLKLIGHPVGTAGNPEAIFDD